MSFVFFFSGDESKLDKELLKNSNAHKYSSPQVHKRVPKSNRLITAKFNSFDTGDTDLPPPSTATASANSSRPPTVGRSRPTTASKSRPTTASKSRPTTAGKSRPTTGESGKSRPSTSDNFQDHKPPMSSTSNVSSRATVDRPKSGTRPLTGSRPQSSRRSIASRKGKTDFPFSI